MSDVIFAEGNTTPHENVGTVKSQILEDMLGPLQDVVENAQGSHANQDLFASALGKAQGLAAQWQGAISADEAKPAPSVPANRDDQVSKLFGVVSNIYDDASQGRETQFDAQRAADLVGILDELSADL